MGTRISVLGVGALLVAFNASAEDQAAKPAASPSAGAAASAPAQPAPAVQPAPVAQPAPPTQPAPAPPAAQPVPAPAAQATPPVTPAQPATSTGAAYGPAGCGLGSMIFSPDSGFTQVFAASTNMTSGQTFGITSGTSNCDTNAAGTASAKVFVQTNRAALAKDIARGRGETISALSSLASCQNASAVGARLQKKFRTIFSSAKATDEQVSDSIVRVLKSDPALRCGNLG